MVGDKSDIEYFWERRDNPDARVELRLALKEEKKNRARDQKKQQLLARSARLESLLHTSGWEELTRLLEEQEQKFWDRHVADVKAGKAIDQRELDRSLGKLDGIRALLGAPVKAATILKRQEEEENAA